MAGRLSRVSIAVILVIPALFLAAPSASATPVCTDGYMGGPPLELCGGRIFPEAETAFEYVQYLPDPVTGFREYQHGIEFLASQYPRWVEIIKLSDVYGDDAVSMGSDGARSYAADDSGDGLRHLRHQADR